MHEPFLRLPRAGQGQPDGGFLLRRRGRLLFQHGGTARISASHQRIPDQGGIGAQDDVFLHRAAREHHGRGPQEIGITQRHASGHLAAVGHDVPVSQRHVMADQGTAAEQVEISHVHMAAEDVAEADDIPLPHGHPAAVIKLHIRGDDIGKIQQGIIQQAGNAFQSPWRSNRDHNGKRLLPGIQVFHRAQHAAVLVFRSGGHPVIKETYQIPGGGLPVDCAEAAGRFPAESPGADDCYIFLHFPEPVNFSMVAQPSPLMPWRWTTFASVNRMMRASSNKLRWSTYQTSSSNLRSQPMELRPLTWAQPVMPGLTSWRAPAPHCTGAGIPAAAGADR